MANVLNKTLIAGAAALTLVTGVAAVSSTADAQVYGRGYYGGRFAGPGYGWRGAYGPRFGYGYRGVYGPRFGVRVGPGFYGPRYGYGYGYRGPYSYRAIF